ncbi:MULTISPECIES: RNA polymerase sigma factor SigF [unclassified Streptomyces]|uniref:RNA polymerase sigma factor SigF n=1 Tax=unclassified Streptomyces TaxID=2593676 RepID=UPI002DDB01AD|nr:MULTISPECIES: RNA polymerase sigma factor SigF [unclassified Streptomyces]WSA93757.1 RNA polymerase sigma factor SigF [Streptomyces sp. NBC_01795]WSB78128.1 RNA polymerase sigma factor SigF [Streptomyces sp. NBC_01775]WSS13620.1 RNA polymerase sigma factor SigF [Streptomyces sp. NBC_01186]WSS42416.1 RNA polymerase sigma factor SigF [Streptomyces sp. NBC_01187]
MSVELGSSKVLAENTTPGAPPGPAEPGSAPAPQDLVEPAAVVAAGAAIDTRTLSRSLFLRLAALDRAAVDSPETAPSAERTYVRDTLIELNLPLVRYAAARFRSRNEPMEDIVQVGTIGLIKAIDRFDCERGVEFPTFAMPTVVGEIKRFFRDTSWSVRVPRRLQELRLALTKASDELSQTLDRSPTVTELATCLGVSEEDVVDGLAVGNAYTASSLDSPSMEDDGGEGSLADRLGYEDTALEGVEYRESLKPLLAKLPPRERQIIMLRFFANMTQSQIGEEVGISQMHVSRLLTRTLAQLREGLIAED